MEEKHRTSQQEDGAWAEDLAVELYETQGYRVRDRNFKTRYGEVDLVVERGIELVFVEVRFRSYKAFGAPDETVWHNKQRKCVMAATEYAMKHRLLDSRAIRFDVVSVLQRKGGHKLEQIRDAFEARL